MGLYTVFFSPTGNTQKSVRTMAEAINPIYKEYDCTCIREKSGLSKYISENENVEFKEEDFVILGIPVYSGRIPQVAKVRLEKFHGNQTPCILVATYGNRHFDDALIELKDMAEKNGFCVRGAAAVVGRHTFGEIAVERPNAEDLLQMAEFAKKAYEKKESIKNLPGNSVYREGGKGGKFRPETTNDCKKCGLCKCNCPVGAINDDFSVSDDTCISCFRCIRNCPVKAKVISTETYLQFAEDFTAKLSVRKENEFYIE